MSTKAHNKVLVISCGLGDDDIALVEAGKGLE